MTEARIGYYAHHHGAGHVTRALAIAVHLPGPLTLFTSALPPDNVPKNVTWRSLPLDFDGHTVVEPVKGLSYAPLNVRGLRERMRILVEWFCDAWPCLLVVDVSIEVALLARLCGIPTVYMRQRGARFDEAHSLAYASAQRLIAPYPPDFEQPETPRAWVAKTDYCGLISRYNGLSDNRSRTKKLVTVVIGHGGTAMRLRRLAEAARSTPDWQWASFGPIESDNRVAIPDNLHLHGAVDDLLPWLSEADVVVGSAGDNLVSEVATLQCRFICVPEDRPYDEQWATARVLDAANLAIHCAAWPSADAWPSLLDRASRLSSAAWEPYANDDGAQAASRAILGAAASSLR